MNNMARSENNEQLNYRRKQDYSKTVFREEGSNTTLRIRRNDSSNTQLALQRNPVERKPQMERTNRILCNLALIWNSLAGILT